MEASERDALAEDAPATGDDPFEGVPADGGGEPDPDLVAPGELGGENPSTDDPLAEEQEELPEAEADPLAEPDPADVLQDPEAEEEEEPEPEPEPDPVPEEGGVPDDSVGSEPEPAPDPEPEPEQPQEEPSGNSSGKKKPGGRKKSGAKRSGEREYVVVQCDKNDKPIGIAGEVKTRSDKDARRTVFEGMDDTEAHLVAVPARYWKVRTLKAKTREVKDIEES